MSTYFPYKRLSALRCKSCADMHYKITVSCTGKPSVHDVVSNSCGPLSLVPGVTTGGSDFTCRAPADEMILPACETHITRQLAVPIRMLAAPQASDCIWTSTVKQASVPAAHVGDTITYSVTFTNHSQILLDMVWIADSIGSGTSVIPGSITPQPKPGETLQSGISMGSLGPGQTAVLTYRVTINFAACDNIINKACARYCFRDCQNCRRLGMGSCKCSIVKVISDAAKISVIKYANKNFVCNLCEEITYTLEISNPGKVPLTDVVVYDKFSPGLCYKSNSTTKNNNAPTDENPQNGIYIGNLPPGETVIVAFILRVCLNPCCEEFCDSFENTACARGRAHNTVVCAQSAPCSVWLNIGCLHQCMQRRLPVCDLHCLKTCNLYHTEAAYYNIGLMETVVAGFGIDIKYADCFGKIKRKSFKGNVVFHNLPSNFNPEHFTVYFTDFVYNVTCEGNITAEFTAKLCFCTLAQHKANNH